MPEPPSVLVLHLSDLHFGPYSRFADVDANQLGSRFSEAIKKEIESNDIKVPISLVIVTGDIAEAGLPRQYQTAQDFFESLAMSLRLEHDRFVFVPGNHDVSWPASRRAEADQEEEGFDNDELRRRIDEAKFNNFDNLITSFSGSGLSSNRVELGCKGYVKTFEPLKTSVAVLNSCEAESHRSTDHRGLLSEPQAQALMSHWDDRKFRSYLKVVAIHHNPVTTVLANINEWKEFIQKQTVLDSDLIERYATDIVGFDGHNYLKRISADCEVHLILHGHQHAADEQLWSWPTGRMGHTHVLSAGSGTLIPEKLPKDHPNTVRQILLDRKSNKLISWTLKYDPLAATPGYVELGSFTSAGSAPYQHLLSAAKSIPSRRKTTSAKVPRKSVISADSIMKCIRHGSLSFDQKRRIGLAALQEYYGGHTTKKDSYFNYVVKYFLDWSIADTSIWRENVFSDIEIAQAKKPKAFADRGLLVWRETKTFSLRCSAETATFPLLSGTELMVDQAHISEILEATKFSIRVNNQPIYELADSIKDIDLRELIRDGEVSDERMSIKYDAPRLSWGYRQDIEISNKESTLIQMSETAYLERDDQSYILSSRWPMHKFKVHLRLDAGLRDWEIIQATVGPRRYHSESGGLGTVEIDPTERRWVKVWVPDWVLPGLAVVVEWHPKAST